MAYLTEEMVYKLICIFPLLHYVKGVSYREEHEAFVSNLKGTSAIFFVKGTRRPRFIRDLVFLVLPLLCAMTILSSHIYWGLPCLLILCLIVSTVGSRWVLPGSAPPSPPPLPDSVDAQNVVLSYLLSPHPTYLSLFKGVNLLLTCIAILAVDFKIFPRRFAKTETFGIGLMDLGVGTFVVASGITSSYARGKPRGERHVRLWVLALGVLRTLAVKLAGYQEHVSEYGTHWNFFLSLFCVWSAADTLHRWLPRKALPWVAIALLLLYQSLLQLTGLTDYILSAPRTTFISCNREGIFSLLGYLPLLLLAETGAFQMFFLVAIPGLSETEKETTHCKVTDDIDSEEGGTGLQVEGEGEAEDLGPDICESVVLGAYTEDSGSGSGSAALGRGVDGRGSGEGDCSAAMECVLQSVGTVAGSVAAGCRPADSEGEAASVGAAGVPRWRLLGQKPLRRLVVQLAVSSAVLWLGWAAASSLQPTSRRLANLAYVLLVLSLSCFVLLALLLADVLGGLCPYRRVLTLNCLSSAQLPVFLVANVLTGLVNSTIRTLYVTPSVALLILSVYCTAVCGVAWVLAHNPTALRPHLHYRRPS